MRILHYLSEVVLSHGGVVRAVLDLCDALARSTSSGSGSGGGGGGGGGHDVTLLTFDDRDVPAPWKSDSPRPGVPRAVTIPWPRRHKQIRRFDAPTLARIDTLVRAADIVHMHVPWENTNRQVAALCARATPRKPYFVSIHGMLDDWTFQRGGLKKRLFLRFGARAVLEGAAAVLCTADAEREQARCRIPRANLEVLPLILDLSMYRELPTRDAARRAVASLGASSVPIAPTTPLLLFLSRLHPKKGLERLIDALPALHARGERAILLIAGSADPVTTAPGYEATLRARASASGVSEHIRFLGHVTGADKAHLLRAATLTVLPTSQENWGFSLVESLACATPILTTRGVDIWRELECSGGAPPSLELPVSADALADALSAALRDPARLGAMGDAGRAWVMRELDPESITRRYEELYRRAIAPRAP